MSFDEKLQWALELYEKQWLATLPDENDPALEHTFSKRFERKMRRLIGRRKKRYYPLINMAWKRVALAVAVFALMAFAAMSVKAIREPVVRFFIMVYEKFSTVVFGDVYSVPEARIDQVFEIGNLPNEFQLQDRQQQDTFVRTLYVNPEGMKINFYQLLSASPLVQFDSENTEHEEVNINNAIGCFYHNKDANNLFWSDGTYLFWLISGLEKNALAAVAASICPAK